MLALGPVRQWHPLGARIWAALLRLGAFCVVQFVFVFGHCNLPRGDAVDAAAKAACLLLSAVEVYWVDAARQVSRPAEKAYDEGMAASGDMGLRGKYRSYPTNHPGSCRARTVGCWYSCVWVCASALVVTGGGFQTLALVAAPLLLVERAAPLSTSSSVQREHCCGFSTESLTLCPCGRTTQRHWPTRKPFWRLWRPLWWSHRWIVWALGWEPPLPPASSLMSRCVCVCVCVCFVCVCGRRSLTLCRW
jgi:hypothetical protein